MSWCDRRSVILGLGALALLPSCGFTPAYGPEGGAGRLSGAVGLAPPDGRAGYLLNRRLEDRLGRAAPARYMLETEIETGQSDLGTTSTGSTTRYRIVGSVSYRLKEAGGETVLAEDRVESFTGYSATGTSVATLAAERDALERLMTILADRIVDQLIVAAPDLP